MLTPQEVSERAFQKASFGGYNMSQVDEFLDVLTEDYTALYNENTVLKNKMKVLVEKVEEYRSTEDAMRKALMTAQRMAEETVRTAEEKKIAILAEAEEMARARTENIVSEVEAEQFRLAEAKKATAAYVARLREMHEKEVAFLDQLQELVPPQASADDHVDQTAAEIDDNIQRLLAQPAAEEQADDMSDTSVFEAVTAEAIQEEEGDGFETRRIDFGELQFGRDYEIK